MNMDQATQTKERILSGQIRERIFALFCLTVIALVAMFRLSDPENIIINIIVGITSFVGGVAVGNSRRKEDDNKQLTP